MYVDIFIINISVWSGQVWLSGSGLLTAANVRHVQTERSYQAFPLLGLQRHPLLLDLLLPTLTLVEHGKVVS